MTSTIKDLKGFKFERVLNEDPVTHSLVLLGTLQDNQGGLRRLPAILRIQRTALASESAEAYCSESLDKIELIESNDIYTWLFGWFGATRDSDVKIHIIFPATDVHIRKYTMQERVLIRETPELYRSIVKPYIDAFPPARTQWVEDILSGKSESGKVLYNDPCPSSGFLILPDMKWDLKTLSSLYLIAITRSKDLKSLRDLRREHLGMLRSIRREAARVVKEKWGLEPGATQLLVHYQPSYYHFHVHIVGTRQEALTSVAVGQARLLDDVISMLEVDSDQVLSLFERMTLTYVLGDQHGLFELMKAAQAGLLDE